MKFLLLTCFILSTFLAYTQKDNLVPYFENGKWGYCNENLEKVIEPKFDFALPFYNGLGFVEIHYFDSLKLDEYYDNDSNGNEYHKVNYLNFTSTKSAIIDSKGNFIIEPFLGSLDYNNDFVIINYGKLEWSSNMSEDGKKVWQSIIETDSSWVINYNREKILRSANGYFSFYTDQLISYHARDSVNQRSFNRVGLYYNGKLIFDETFLKKDCNCTDVLCWSVADSVLTIFDLSGKQIGNYIMSENEKSYTGIPLDKDKIMFSWTDEYKIVNCKGENIETKPLWLHHPDKIQEVHELIKNESWRSPMKKYYAYNAGDVIIDFGKGTKMIILERGRGDLPSQYFLIDKKNPERKLGPFIHCTPFFNGNAFVTDSISLFIINENGEFVSDGISMDVIEYPVELVKSKNDFLNEFVIIYDNKKKTGNLYYCHVSGKKYKLK